MPRSRLSTFWPRIERFVGKWSPVDNLTPDGEYVSTMRWIFLQTLGSWFKQFWDGLFQKAGSVTEGALGSSGEVAFFWAKRRLTRYAVAWSTRPTGGFPRGIPVDWNCSARLGDLDFVILVLVGGLEPWNFMTFHILGIIVPTDELIFFRGVETTNQIYL